MAYSGVIIVTTKGSLPPKSYLELALKENPSAVGVAFDNGTELQFLRDKTTAENGTITSDELLEMMEKNKDSRMVLHLANGEDIPDNCLQPFDVLTTLNKDKEIVPYVQMFLEGDFSSFTQMESAQTDEYFAANKVAIPFIQRLYKQPKAGEEDIAKLIGELNDPLNRQMMMNTAATAGAITVVFKGYPPMTFDKGRGGSQFPWGWVSKTFGYKEDAPKAPVEKPGVVAKVTNALSIRGNKKSPVTTDSPAPEAAPVEVEAPKENKEGPRGTPKTDVEAAQQEVLEQGEGEHDMLTPGKELSGKTLKAFYNKNCAFLPPNWYERPAAPRKTVLKAFSEIPKDKGKPVYAAGAQNTEIKYEHKDTRTPAEVLPTIPAEKLETNKLHIVNLDRNNKPIDDDPKVWTGLVAKYPTLTDQHGLPSDAYDNKSFNWFRELQDLDAKDGTYSLGILAFNFLCRIKDLEDSLSSLTAPDAEGTEPEITPVKQAASGGQLSVRRK